MEACTAQVKVQSDVSGWSWKNSHQSFFWHMLGAADSSQGVFNGLRRSSITCSDSLTTMAALVLDFCEHFLCYLSVAHHVVETSGLISAECSDMQLLFSPSFRRPQINICEFILSYLIQQPPDASSCWSVVSFHMLSFLAPWFWRCLRLLPSTDPRVLREYLFSCFKWN